MLVNPPKALNLPQLQQELAAAGNVVRALGSTGDPASEVHTYNAQGVIVDLPAAAAAVIAAHVAGPTAEQLQRVHDAVVILNNVIVMADQPTRDAMARSIGVQPLTIPISQKAVATDIHPLGGSA